MKNTTTRKSLILICLLVATLLLSGCGLREALFGPRAPREPVPPMQPPAFAEFDDRVYLPDRLSIPAIELEIPVVELGWSATTDPGGRVFSQWDVAEYAGGWHKNSALLGQGGNVVMSGHNNILGSVFRELDQLEQGDMATVRSGGVDFVYSIDQVLIVPDKHATEEQRMENAKWIAEYDDDRLTLVSCWPRDDNTHRIIVVAHRIDDDGATTARTSATTQ